MSKTTIKVISIISVVVMVAGFFGALIYYFID